MNIERHSDLDNRHNGLRRVLAFSLLVLILYGTTIQAVHGHGPLDETPSKTASVSNPEAGDRSPLLAGCTDCLICQLHQSFSAPLVTHRQFDSPDLQTVFFNPSGANDFSTFVMPRETGRAPPLTS